MRQYRLILLLFTALIMLACGKKEENQKEIEPQIQTRQSASPLFTFGAIADVQYCDCDPHNTRYFRESPAKFEACVRDLNSRNPDFTIHLGDFIDQYFKSFDVVMPIWEKLTMPKYHVLGNHEFYVEGDEKDKILGRLGMTGPYYDFKLKGWRLVVTDGTDIHARRNPNNSEADKAAHAMYEKMQKKGTLNAQKWNGALSETQMAWLDATLADAARKGEKALVFGHFGVYPRSMHSLWNDEDVQKILEKHNCVVAYFNGHDHEGNYGEKNGIHYVNLKGMVETPDETAYAVVEVYEDHLKVNGVGQEPSRDLQY